MLSLLQVLSLNAIKSCPFCIDVDIPPSSRESSSNIVRLFHGFATHLCRSYYSASASHIPPCIFACHFSHRTLNPHLCRSCFHHDRQKESSRRDQGMLLSFGLLDLSFPLTLPAPLSVLLTFRSITTTSATSTNASKMLTRPETTTTAKPSSTRSSTKLLSTPTPRSCQSTSLWSASTWLRLPRRTATITNMSSRPCPSSTLIKSRVVVSTFSLRRSRRLVVCSSNTPK